jgi:hypothetical protein
MTGSSIVDSDTFAKAAALVPLIERIEIRGNTSIRAMYPPPGLFYRLFNEVPDRACCVALEDGLWLWQVEFGGCSLPFAHPVESPGGP